MYYLNELVVFQKSRTDPFYGERNAPFPYFTSTTGRFIIKRISTRPSSLARIKLVKFSIAQYRLWDSAVKKIVNWPNADEVLPVSRIAQEIPIPYNFSIGLGRLRRTNCWRWCLGATAGALFFSKLPV